MKPQKRTEKAEKIFGYTLLVIGLILIIISVMLAILMLLGVMNVPELVPAPAGDTSDYVKSMVIFSNVCMIFFILIITVWAGSILSSRGVTMIKDVKLKLVGKSLQEAEETKAKIESKKEK
jgi:ABC-type lipoprotein release transport system permease subunit